MQKLILPPLIFLSYSLGCRTNQAEIEDIGLQLIANGFKQTDKNPNLVLLNTCVVTQKAEKETRQKIRELKKKNPNSFLVVLGCGVTAEEKLKIDLPQADLFISNKEKENTVKIILKNCHSDRTAVSGEIPLSRQLEAQTKVCYYKNVGKGSLPPKAGRDDRKNKYQLSGRKFIKIQDGCNCGCSFCLTQFLRGKPTSILPEKIIEEINFWVKNGIKEIILTGINIGLYNYHGRRLKSAITFLVDKTLNETKVERISLSSIYPEMLTDDFIKIVINNPRVSQYFHLSLQSGSQTVLNRMNRKTDLNKLSEKMIWIKEKNPYFTFRADIITGFPNETEEEFQETLDFIKKAKISFVHHFLFSRRQHTKSEVMIESKTWKEVPMKVKKERQKKLLETVEKIRKEEAKHLIGKLVNCLIVRELHCHSDYKRRLKSAITKKQERDPSRLRRVGMTQWEGITENGWIIRIYNVKCKMYNLKGKMLPIKIIGFKEEYLLGKIGPYRVSIRPCGF